MHGRLCGRAWQGCDETWQTAYFGIPGRLGHAVLLELNVHFSVTKAELPRKRICSLSAFDAFLCIQRTLLMVLQHEVRLALKPSIFFR